MIYRLFALFAAALLAGGTGAKADGFAVGAKASTLGAGLEVTTNVVPFLANLRIQGNGFNYNTTINNTSVTYDAKLKLRSVGVIADIYPFLVGKFRVSVGAYYNDNQLSLTGVPTGGTYTFNGTSYTSAQAGTVTGTMKFNKFAPYLGIGWGDSVSSGSPLGINVDLGVLYQGKPKTTLTATGNAAGLAGNVAAEQAKLDNNVKKYKFYPVVGVGVTWKF